MTPLNVLVPDQRLDFVVKREHAAPVELVWEAMTQPEHVRLWFMPAPWVITACDIDLRPGGIFRRVMRSPDGEETTSIECYLEIVAYERLVWTNALLPGFRPAENPSFTAIATLERSSKGTLHTAMVIHRDETARRKNEAMGFEAGLESALKRLERHAMRA